jgi:mRNA-degrading endonuclease RelE of RelBE toxin-antitoxin system
LPATRVFIDKKAQKQLEQLPRHIQIKISTAIDLLEQEGFSKKLDINKLKGLPNHFRVRVGTYRILFIFAYGDTITIYAIQHRKSAYTKI